MFLRGGKDSKKRFIEVDIKLKAKLSTEEIAERIASLRNKYSLQARNELIGFLLPVAVSVASRYALYFNNMDKDLLSVAYLELTRVIDVIVNEGACEHEGYIQYISMSISGRCARSIEAARLIRIPYEVTQQPNASFPGCVIASDASLNAACNGQAELLDTVDTYIEVANLSDREKLLVDMRLNGLTFLAIAQAMNLDPKTIRAIRDSAHVKMKKVLYP